MKTLSLIVGFMISSVSLASPKIDLEKAGFDECSQRAANLVERYTDLFDLGSAVKTIRFENFENTTRGSYNQEYEALVTLVFENELELGVSTSQVKVVFSSPFICEDLKILDLVKLPAAKSELK